jgi:hypothetical protein
MEEVCLETRCIRELGWSITQVATSTMADMQRELNCIAPVEKKTSAEVENKTVVVTPEKETHVTKRYECVTARLAKMSHLLNHGALHQVDALFLRETIQRESILQEEYRVQLRADVLGSMKSKQQMLVVFLRLVDENTSIKECTATDRAAISRLQEELITHQQNLQLLQTAVP